MSAERSGTHTTIHGAIEMARGLCTDEAPYPMIDQYLAGVSDAARALEAKVKKLEDDNSDEYERGYDSGYEDGKEDS